MAACPRPFTEQGRGHGFSLKHGLATAPVAAQALDLAVNRHLETRIGDDDRGCLCRQQRSDAAQEAVLDGAVVERLLRMHFLIRA
jgi:hypothetical protein